MIALSLVLSAACMAQAGQGGVVNPPGLALALDAPTARAQSFGSHREDTFVVGFYSLGTGEFKILTARAEGFGGDSYATRRYSHGDIGFEIESAGGADHLAASYQCEVSQSVIRFWSHLETRYASITGDHTQDIGNLAAPSVRPLAAIDIGARDSAYKNLGKVGTARSDVRCLDDLARAHALVGLIDAHCLDLLTWRDCHEQTLAPPLEHVKGNKQVIFTDVRRKLT